MNIYHGKFDETTGYSTHLHYHSDKDENNNKKKYHEHIHYHQGENADKHDNFSDKADKNVVLCILFNRDTHKGTPSNIFFDQFVHESKI